MLLKDTEQLNDLRDFLTNWYSDYDDSYGIPVEANNDNSPVYCNQCMLWDDNAKGYIIINNSLYHFFKSFCLQEVVFGCKNLYAIGEEIDNIQELFDRPIEKVWVNGYYINPKEDGPTHSFYCCENVLVMITHGEYWLGYNCERPTVLNYNVFSSLKSTKNI